MFLTFQGLIDLAWSKHSQLWLEEDVKKLIKEKKLVPHYLGGRMIFKTTEVEEFFGKR